MKTLLLCFKQAIFLASILFSLPVFSQANNETFQFTNASLVQKESAYVQLEWHGKSENVSYFIIEKSEDGKNFSRPVMVFASEDPEFKDYKYRDKEFQSGTGITYYRIGVVDEDKEVNIVGVKKVTVSIEKNTLSIAAFPNPVSETLKVDLPNSWMDKKLELAIYSFEGIKISSHNIEKCTGAELISIKNIKPGKYILKVLCDKQEIATQVVKR